MTKLRLIALFVLLLAGLSALLVWQNRMIQRLQLANAEMLAQTAELESLRAENSRLVKSQTDPAELDRLRAAQTELLRLRGETTRLRQQLKTKQDAQKITPPSEQAVTAEEPPASPVDAYVANVRANVPWQHALVTGGWTTPGGNRALLLIEPHVVGRAGQILTDAATPGAQVVLRTRIVELPDELLTQAGLGALRADGRQSNSQLILTPEQAEKLLKSFQGVVGANILASPTVITGDGREAQVKVVEAKTTASGENYETGPTINIVPTISADRASVDLSVSARLQYPAAPSR